MASDLSIEARLKQLEGEFAVAAVVQRYADALDSRQFDRAWDCFTSDAEVTGTEYSGAIGDYLPLLLARVRSFESTMHFIGNQLRTVDGETAHTETYAIAHHFFDAEGTEESIVIGVVYTDDLVRSADGEWKIRHRSVRALWRRETELPELPPTT